MDKAPQAHCSNDTVLLWQVKLQEGVRDVETHSGGGTISCKLSPSPTATSAALKPRSGVTLGDGIQFKVMRLHVLVSERGFVSRIDM